MPDWFNDPGDRKAINQRSKEQELKVAKDIGGKRQPGSGSFEFAPQDVKSDNYLIQIKYTDSTAFRLKVLEWHKIRQDAIRFGKEPVMVVEFPIYKTKLVIRECIDLDELL